MLYRIQRDDQFYGPYSREEIDRYLQSSQILMTDLAKSDEMPDWVPVALLLGAPPPPIEKAFMSYGDPSYLQAPERSGDFFWFPISPVKFVVMHFCTFGLYTVYWAYKQWDRVSTRETEPMMPWARAIFSGIWNFSLFQRVEQDATQKGIPVTWNYALLASLVILMTVVGYVLHPPWTIIVFVSFLPWLPVITTINTINSQQLATVDERPNDHYSPWNIAGIVVGGSLKILALVGTLMAIR